MADEFETSKKQKNKKEGPKTFTKIGSYKGVTVSIKFINRKSIELTRKLRQEMQFFKDMNQENLNRIIGACIDPPNICIITLYCSRGSLNDILSNKDICLDEIFVASLLFDLIKVWGRLMTCDDLLFAGNDIFARQPDQLSRES